MCVHGSQAVYCTTELCLSVDKLKEEKKHREGTMLVYIGNVVVYILSTVKLRVLTCSMIFPAVPDPNPQEDDAKFREFSKRAEDGPSRASWLSKTFPELPMVLRVSSGNPESRLSIPTQNRQGLAGTVGRSRAARCHRIVNFSCIGHTNSPCSVNPEFESKS